MSGAAVFAVLFAVSVCIPAGWCLRVAFEPQSLADMRQERDEAQACAAWAQHDVHVLAAELELRDAEKRAG